MVGHNAWLLLYWYTFSIWMPCPQRLVVILGDFFIGGTRICLRVRIIYLVHAHGDILIYEVSNSGSPLSHFLLQLLCFIAFRNNLSVDLLFLRYKFIRILLCLGFRDMSIKGITFWGIISLSS